MSETISLRRPAYLTRACSAVPSRKFTVPILACLVGLSAATANAASPTVGAVNPWGGQRGSELEIFLGGDRLSDARQILFYKPGIDVVSLEVVNNNQVKAKIKIAPDCALGEHPLRLRTATGISELRVFQVGMFPAIAEMEPNSDFAQPQAIPLNSTVAGTVENEDVDYFVVEAKKGERISAEVEAIRLGITLFDVYVAILDEKRFELAANDDTALLLQDTYASVIAPEDGKYIVQVRESAYGGNGSCQYRLHVGHFPRPSAVYPPGGKVGEELTVAFLGDVAGEASQTFKLPEAPRSDYGLFLEQNGQSSPSPNPFRVTDLVNVLEAEPNNDFPQATQVPTPLPIACNGIISEAGDVDCFRVTASAGQVFDIHVYARRLRSALDSVLTVHDVNGKTIAGNDDAFGPDSYLRFQVPADGEYFLRVTDHLGKGGPDYVYRIEAQPVASSLTLAIPQVARSSQERQTVPVPRGNRYATLIQANRVNFGGELALGADGLPEKVSIRSENMAENLGLVPVVFEAEPDAPLAGALADLFATHADPNQKIRGSLLQNVDLVTGPPNITVYYQTSVDRLAVAVTEEAPFKITVVEPKVPLVQNGSMELKVVAERKEGFATPITLYFPFQPPGIGAASSVTIAEGQTEARYPINANSGAQTRKWNVVVTAQATVGNGPVWVSSQLIPLEVAPPFVTLGIQMAATEQGKPTEVVCKLTQNTPFEGSARAILHGLPAHVSTQEMQITKDSQELVFPVTTAEASPAGQHGTLFCQVIVTKDDEPIVHNLGYGGVLRIDPPPPPKKDEPAPAPVAAAAPAEPPPPAPMPEKRLTRLEKLRLEQAERAKQKAALLAGQ